MRRGLSERASRNLVELGELGRESESLREFRRESAFRFILTLTRRAATGTPIRTVARSFRSGSARGRCRTLDSNRSFSWLSGVCAEDFVLQWCAIKTANNRLHFVRCRSLYKREAFRLLRFVVPDHLDRIRDKIFRR